MWKYLDLNKYKEFIISLNLIDLKITDEKKINILYTISNTINKNYKICNITNNNKIRKIYIPSNNLKHIQRNILKNILVTKSVSIYSKAYMKNYSIIDNVKPHLNNGNILKLDIKNFFDNITYELVHNIVFPESLYPKGISHLLTELCTYNGYLPQGAPSSAYISNLILRNFDYIIGNYCNNNNIVYTRYSDDLTFSGDFNKKELIVLIKEELGKLNLHLNYKKVRLLKQHNRKIITGIIINKKLQSPKNYRKDIRKSVYYINKFGIKNHLIKNDINEDSVFYLKKIYGKILYILQIDKNNQEFIKYKNIIKKLIH